MRNLLFASASLLLVGGTALAQTATTTHANMMAANSSADQYLTQAQGALRSGHTAAAREALERAETRLLSRSTPASQASMPSSNPKLMAVTSARQALSKRDRAGAMQSIQTALATPETGGMADTGVTGVMPATPTTPSNPLVSVPTSPNVPPNSLGGIGSSTGTDAGSGVGTRSRPQASFSGPANANTVVPTTSGDALGATGQVGSAPATVTPAQ